MNDFTKEELGIIACNLCINPKTKSILLKLEMMINNCREHSCNLIEKLENYLILIKKDKGDIIDHNSPEEDIHWISGFLTAIDKIEAFLLMND